MKFKKTTPNCNREQLDKCYYNNTCESCNNVLGCGIFIKYRMVP